MGSTLTNGIYLPAEGERNCYTGLAANWSALDSLIGGYNAHIGNTTIHVTAEDKQAWNGKADASALTAHTGDTSIHVTAADKQAWNGHVADLVKHVTAEDKNKWDAVTSKADDSDVVHKSGNETVDGQKIFTHGATGLGRDSYHFAIVPYGKNTPPANTSFQYVWFHGNTASQGFTNSWYGGFLEQVINTDGSAHGRWLIRDTSESTVGIRLFVNGSDKQVRPTENNAVDLGTSTNKWKSFNGLEPSALGMPDLNNGIDISAYITDLTGTSNINRYTPTVNGWLSIGLSGADFIELYIPSSRIGGTFAKSTVNNYAQAFMPVMANKEVRISLKGSSIGWAKFYPCQGNT